MVDYHMGMAVPRISLQEFALRLFRHDWYYSFSDDHRTWVRGQITWRELQVIAAQSDDHAKVFTWARKNRNKFNKVHERTYQTIAKELWPDK